jgi:pyridoxal/pyridoxine/pyridoxamine kinase
MCHLVCDPVIGDLGRFYVEQDVAECIKASLVPLAAILTPNQFELEYLVGETFLSESHVLHAMRRLCRELPCLQLLVLTSFQESPTSLVLYGCVVIRHNSDSDNAVPMEKWPRKENDAFLYPLHAQPSDDEDQTGSPMPTFPASSVACLRIRFPKKKETFSGTGDTFAALLLGWYQRLQTRPPCERARTACERALNGIQDVLEVTVRKYYQDAHELLVTSGNAASQQAIDQPTPKMEVALVAAQRCVEHPTTTYCAEWLVNDERDGRWASCNK